jgi:hypothetical protein
MALDKTISQCIVAAFTLFASCNAVRAQQPDETTQTPDQASSNASTTPPRPPDKHLFGLLPNYRTADSTQVFRALTPREKFVIAVHDSFDPPGFFVVACYTAVYQAVDTNPEFGQGVKGYAHRYATTYADYMIGNVMTEGAMPSLLHEDPRYYPRGHGSVPLRMAWALSRIVVTRTDRDTYRFNFSEFLGNAVTAGIGNAYYTRDRTLGDNAGRLGTQVMADSIANVLKEFWPDIKKAFHLGPLHKHEPQPQSVN